MKTPKQKKEKKTDQYSYKDYILRLFCICSKKMNLWIIVMFSLLRPPTAPICWTMLYWGLAGLTASSTFLHLILRYREISEIWTALGTLTNMIILHNNYPEILAIAIDDWWRYLRIWAAIWICLIHKTLAIFPNKLAHTFSIYSVVHNPPYV